MSKKTFLSALLISTLGFSSTFAAAEVSEMGAPASVVGFKNGVFAQFPLNSTTRDSLPEISFQNCTLKALDPAFFTNNSILKKLALVGSSANFTIFAGGKFCQGCSSLEVLNLKDIKEFTFENFLSVAASDLLDRIMAETCKLKFSRADSGATLARFSQDTKSEELSLEEIKRYISMYRTAQAAATAKPSADQPASPNTGGLWGTVWSMFGSTTTTK